MYEQINDFIVGMVKTHDKGYMLVFTTFVHIYIFLWEPIVHDHSGSKSMEMGEGVTRGVCIGRQMVVNVVIVN